MGINEILSKLDFCNCGNPDTAYEVLYEVLSFHDRSGSSDAQWKLKCEDQKKFFDKVGEGTFYLLLYFLCAAGLTEHGGSVGGGWLTDDGRLLLKHLEEQGLDPDEWNINS